MATEFIFGSTEKPFTGRKMAALILGFFMTIITVNAVFVWFALSTWTGLQTEAPYDKGLHYNETLAAAAAQKAQAWQIDTAIEPLANGRHRLVIDAAGDNNAPLTKLAVSARLRRPTQADMDFALVVGGGVGGRYTAEFKAPALGNWDLVLVADDIAGGRHRMERRLWLK